jgi:TonB family protein
MIELHRILLSALLNSLWQIPVLIAAALLCAYLLRRASFTLQHRLWIATLILCLLVPFINATGVFAPLFNSVSTHIRPHRTPTAKLFFDGNFAAPITTPHTTSIFAVPTLANTLLILWLGLILFRTIRILVTWRRTRTIVRNATPATLSLEIQALWQQSRSSFRLPTTRLLVSDQISTPAALGFRIPIVLIPAAFLTNASEPEFQAIFAHESAHLHRRDFLRNLLYELVALPFAWHPAMHLLRSRISDTRELICDRLATEGSANPVAYAQSLVRIASSLSRPIPTTAPALGITALGIFDGQNLENRIMTLLDHTPRLNRRSAAITAVFCAIILTTCCVAASAFTFQPAAIVSKELQPYAGSWNWMFKGKPFITMRLVPEGDHFTGYMTNGFFNQDGNGTMTDAGGEPGTSNVSRTYFAGKVLHIVIEDPRDKSNSEWTMTLITPDKAEFNSADADRPKNMKPWTALRASDAQPEVNAGSVYHIGAGVSAPVVISQVNPDFPPGHTEKDFSGNCLVSLIVTADGQTENVQIVKSLAPDFDQKALEAVRQYKFKPAIYKGKPVPVALKIEVNFQRF